MADNYLETRYEQIFGKEGAATKHGATKPSLDSLLKRTLTTSYDTSYKVHHLQAEAIVRSAETVFGKECISCKETDGKIYLSIDCDDAFTSGRIFQVLQLKAAEMGLGLKNFKDNYLELTRLS